MLARDIEMFIEHCGLKGLSTKTINSYEQTLRLFMQYIDEQGILLTEKITHLAIQGYIKSIKERGKYTVTTNPNSGNYPDRRVDFGKRVSDVTINNYLRNLRVFFNWCVEEELILRSPVKKGDFVKVERKPLEFVSDEDFKRLLKSMNSASFSEYRDSIIIQLLLDTGMRVNECLLIEVTDLDMVKRCIMYYNIALLDVASLHPHSAVALNYFGDYTKNFNDLMDVRIYVKHGEYDKAKKLFGGKLSKYLDDPAQAKALAQALKIAINSVYGLTSATFDNPFRNPKNANNIVALRGALFMRTLQDEVQQRGFTVAHIKTDSIKIPDATPEIIDFCMDFAKKYGYTFEHEATYEKMCLVNNAVYIAKYQDADTAKAQYGYIPEKNEKKGGHWTATGAQFQVPYYECNNN